MSDPFVVGSTIAFDDFVAERFQALLRFGRVLTGSTPAAEGLVQTALTKSYPKWDRIEAADPEGYVRRVMANTHASWWRQLWPQRRYEQPPDLAAGSDPQANLELRRAIWRALVTLSPRQRAALALRFYEDLPVDEIARVLGCPVGTAESLVSRGLATLRESTGPHEAVDLGEVARVLGQIGSAPVRTELSPSEVVERVHRRRRVMLAWRSPWVVGAAALVVAAAVVVPWVVRGEVLNARPLAQSDRSGATVGQNGSVGMPPPWIATSEGTYSPPQRGQEPSTLPPPVQSRQPSSLPSPVQSRQPSTLPPPVQTRQPSSLPPPVQTRQPSTPPSRVHAGRPDAPAPDASEKQQQPDRSDDRQADAPDKSKSGGQQALAKGLRGMSVMGMRVCNPVQANGQTYNVVVKDKGVRCADGRRVIRKKLKTGAAPSDWTCRNRESDLMCTRGKNFVLADDTN